MSEKNFIFGTRAVIEAIKSDKEIEKLLIRKGLENEQSRELLDMARQFKIPVQFVPPQKLDTVTRKNHQGVIAFVSEVIYYNIEEIIQNLFENGQNPLILVLDRITDVRNFGAICRSAECAGVHAVVIPDKGAAQINADAVKTSAGALNKIKICRTSRLRNTVLFLKNSGLQIISASEKAENFYFKTDFSHPSAIVMGSEESGISAELLAISDQFAKIPILGDIQSLNVASAASIILFEAVKQRMV